MNILRQKYLKINLNNRTVEIIVEYGKQVEMNVVNDFIEYFDKFKKKLFCRQSCQSIDYFL